MAATDAIATNLAAVHARIAKAANAAGRDSGQIELLAVCKAQPAERVRALAELGQRAVAENYMQESLSKIVALADLGLKWHFIGRLQTNKTKLIAEHFDWVQSVDRMQIAERLSAQRPAARPPLQVLLQVNVSAEPQKGGVEPHELPALAAAIGALPNLVLRGLMCIPALSTPPAARHAAYRRLRQSLDDLRRQFDADDLALDQLSMGMSDDLEAAVAEGATMVRVGTALFGPRE